MRNRTIIVLFVLSAALSCISKQRPNKEMSKNNLNISYNEINTISGVYAKGILSQREEGDHMGHYKIIVNDTLEITLLPPYSKEAKKDQLKKLSEWKADMLRLPELFLKELIFQNHR